MSIETRPTQSTFPISPAVMVVMGVSGCGKSTIGVLLARRLRWEFEDADWLHPAANVDKMHNGIPLTDEDRRYRDVLIGDRADIRLVFLKGDGTLIARRIATRHEHFMPRSLLHSQFEAIEEPGPDERPIVASIEPEPGEIVARILSALKMIEDGLPAEQRALAPSGHGA
jgi:gluconokinase